ncbi:MAG: RagB/SusD family nutrient uptake outer membrane protein [Aureibaculum sp.]
MKTRRIFSLSLAALVATTGLLFQSCTDLEEKALDGVRQESAETQYAVSNDDAGDLLAGAYANLRGAYQAENSLVVLGEHTTDALVGPTRGGDWDDNGVFRALHTLTYAPDHLFNRDTYTNLLSYINQCNFVLGASPSTQQEAEARFLRAMHYYHVIDLWGQAPYREIGSDPNENALVRSRAEATDWVISEIEAVVGNLPASDPTKANQNAAHWLLAKLYLNKGVFKADNPAGPYTFDNADMAQVVSHVDAITGKSVAADYWDNFIPLNTETSSEIILVSQNFLGGPVGNIQSRWRMTQHYNQNPSGWNGFATTAEYYNKFDSEDIRIKKYFDDVTENSGYNVGFQVGQQYGPGGTEQLFDRPGNPLIFTPSVTLITGGSSLETAGIRGIKYKPDYNNVDNPNNDMVIARYADALLMKAEAMARMGDTPGAQALVQQLPNESSTTISSVDNILDVRARELWWEGWRRNDRIRFGIYLSPRELKNYESDPRSVLMPIPADALANPNIAQNPGY